MQYLFGNIFYFYSKTSMVFFLSLVAKMHFHMYSHLSKLPKMLDASAAGRFSSKTSVCLYKLLKTDKSVSAPFQKSVFHY